MSFLFFAQLLATPTPALCQPCPPCPETTCSADAREIPINWGLCAPNWVMVKNPHAGECKEFAENFADLCAQCGHNVKYVWCNRPHPRGYASPTPSASPSPTQTPAPCPTCPPIEPIDTCPERVEIQAKNRQIELLRKQARVYKARIAKLEGRK